MALNPKYAWLSKIEGLPKMIVEALKLCALDAKEVPGAGSNPVIMQLAKEADVSDIYKSDETAWCAVAMTAIALRAGKSVPFTGYARLRAASFEYFGTRVTTPMLGDVLVFNREGGYHVGQYIAEDETCYHVAGGNQGNQFSIVRIEKKRLEQARRPEYKIGVPAAVKRYFVASDGSISKNEA